MDQRANYIKEREDHLATLSADHSQRSEWVKGIMALAEESVKLGLEKARNGEPIELSGIQLDFMRIKARLAVIEQQLGIDPTETISSVKRVF